MADRAAAFLETAENSPHLSVLQTMVDGGAWREYRSPELAACLGRHQAVYPVLRRLEADGLVESRWDYEPKRWSEDNGRARYYKLTETATELLEPADTGSRQGRTTRRTRLASTVVGLISSVQREPDLEGFRLLRSASLWYPEVERSDFLDETSDHLRRHLADGRKRSAYLVGLSEWCSAARSASLSYLRSSRGDWLGAYVVEILILSLLGGLAGGLLGWLNGWLALGLLPGLLTGAIIGVLGGPTVGGGSMERAVHLLIVLSFAVFFGALTGGLASEIFGSTTGPSTGTDGSLRRTRAWLPAVGSAAVATAGVLLWHSERLAKPFVAWLRRRLV